MYNEKKDELYSSFFYLKTYRIAWQKGKWICSCLPMKDSEWKIEAESPEEKESSTQKVRRRSILTALIYYSLRSVITDINAASIKRIIMAK